MIFINTIIILYDQYKIHFITIFISNKYNIYNYIYIYIYIYIIEYIYIFYGKAGYKCSLLSILYTIS